MSEGTDITNSTAGKTLSDKLWDAHVVRQEPGGPDLLYIDLHLVHDPAGLTTAVAAPAKHEIGRVLAQAGNVFGKTGRHKVHIDGTGDGTRRKLGRGTHVQQYRIGGFLELLLKSASGKIGVAGGGRVRRLDGFSV